MNRYYFVFFLCDFSLPPICPWIHTVCYKWVRAQSVSGYWVLAMDFFVIWPSLCGLVPVFPWKYHFPVFTCVLLPSFVYLVCAFSLSVCQLVSVSPPLCSLPVFLVCTFIFWGLCFLPGSCSLWFFLFQFLVFICSVCFGAFLVFISFLSTAIFFLFFTGLLCQVFGSVFCLKFNLYYNQSEQ